MIFETSNTQVSDNLIREQINHIEDIFQGQVPEGLSQLYLDSLMNIKGRTIEGKFINRLMPNKEYEREVSIRLRLAKKLEQRNKK